MRIDHRPRHGARPADAGEPPAAPAPAAALRERLLLVVLYITVLASSVAFIEPSPHDGLMGVLAIACLVAGVRFERHLALLFLLLLVCNVAGLLSLLNVPGEEIDGAIFRHLGLSGRGGDAVCRVFADNTMSRIATVRAAYVLTATVISLAGIAGYFSLFPARPRPVRDQRPRARRLQGPQRLRPVSDLAGAGGAGAHAGATLPRHRRPIVGILLFALLLSFSRGAWFHFAVSCAVMMTLAFVTADTDRARVRIFGMSAIGLAALAALSPSLLSFDSIGGMFQERAQLIQSYDVGSGGRFRLQELALVGAAQFPNGMGPFEFARVHGLQQHNVYLQAFLVYGWAGGMAYITAAGCHILDRLAHGLRAHALAALSHLRLRRFRRRSARRLRHRYRPLAAFLSVARHDLGLGGGDAELRPRHSRSAAGWNGSPMSALESGARRARAGAAQRLARGCGSACRRTRAARYCSTSAA